MSVIISRCVPHVKQQVLQNDSAYGSKSKVGYMLGIANPLLYERHSHILNRLLMHELCWSGCYNWQIAATSSGSSLFLSNIDVFLLPPYCDIWILCHLMSIRSVAVGIR